METSKQIKMLETYAGISEAELARRLGMSSQAFGQKLKRGTFTPDDLLKIAAAVGASYSSLFAFPDGTTI